MGRRTLVVLAVLCGALLLSPGKHGHRATPKGCSDKQLPADPRQGPASLVRIGETINFSVKYANNIPLGLHGVFDQHRVPADLRRPVDPGSPGRAADLQASRCPGGPTRSPAGRSPTPSLRADPGHAPVQGAGDDRGRPLAGHRAAVLAAGHHAHGTRRSPSTPSTDDRQGRLDDRAAPAPQTVTYTYMVRNTTSDRRAARRSAHGAVEPVAHRQPLLADSVLDPASDNGDRQARSVRDLDLPLHLHLHAAGDSTRTP